MVSTKMESTRGNPRATALMAALLLFTAIAIAAPVEADAAATSVEQCFLDKINTARAIEGAGPLTWAPDIETYTRDHSADMAARGSAGFDGSYHSTSTAISNALPAGWTSWGENIGWQSHPNLPDCTAMHNAFMNSPGHRSNLLNAGFQFAATGTYIDGSGGLWTTHVFFSHPDYLTGFNGTFADDDGSPFEADIEKIAALGVTAGCGGDNFCPNVVVRRDQMAAFLNRALPLPAGPDAGFTDIAGPFEDDINAIAFDGITNGCSTNLYCPKQSLSRGQMAVFLVRAFDLPPAPSAGFGDTAGHKFEDEINRLAAAGITYGCGGGNFCPGGTVTRGQMAAFLARALKL